MEILYEYFKKEKIDLIDMFSFGLDGFTALYKTIDNLTIPKISWIWKRLDKLPIKPSDL